MSIMDFVHKLKQKWQNQQMDFKNMTLMYKNEKIADIEMTEYGIGAIIRVYNKEKFPIGVRETENISLKDSLNMWLEYKTIPQGRPNIATLLEKLHLKTSSELSCKSFYLSLNDNYWFKPANAELQWENINLYDNGFSLDVGDILFDPETQKIEVNYISPDSTTNGLDAKRWIIENNCFYLIKTNYENSQMPYNEVFAEKISKKLGLMCAEYKAQNGIIKILTDSGIKIFECTFAKTKNICDNKSTVLPFGYLRTLTDNNTKKLIEHIKDKHPEVFNEFQKMLVLDFIIANEDRHFDNVAIRIDENGKWHLCDVYDNGNSMYFECKNINANMDDVRCKFLGHKTNKEALQEYIVDFQDISWLNINELKNIASIIKEVYQQSNLSKERIELLIKNVENKIDFLQQYKKLLYQKTLEQEVER